MGERFDSALATSLDSTPDTIDRQFSILGWFYSRYAKRLSDSTILRYEDIVETNGQCLDCLLSRPVRLSVDLENLNEKTGIDKSLLLSLHGKLIENCALFEQFYTKDEVDRLLDRYLIK